ncbi:nitrogen fixation negative regulator NifL [Halochromatium salexigens]|uniref:histidine kinase n=1 Tax=Halochromatium salexigens TaxID=49447 RepID=A0AAJ0UI96_HALSE|nr:nitrogen fixation negative regulator NifL [Halochromatium salexigens]MBK5931984.1 nitrogen fixation negative regulator NifL [Halochromatium salexigens]
MARSSPESSASQSQPSTPSAPSPAASLSTASASASENVEPLVRNAIATFLRQPPAGTPLEVLSALRLMAGDATDPLPPRLYFETVEQAPVAISITDASANILYVNAAFEHLSGYIRDEVLGKNQSILSSNATPDSIYRQLWRTIQRKKTWTGTLVNQRKGGDEYLAELAISPVLDSSGEIAYFLGMHRDVTREHELASALRQQKTRIENVLDAAPTVVVLLDAEGKIILDNMEYKKLFGDLRGHEPLPLIRAALREQAGFDPVERMGSVTGEGDDFKNVEVSLDVPGSLGPRWFSCSGTRISEQDGSARGYFGRGKRGDARLLLLATDVTARHREIERAHLEHLRARIAEQRLAQGMREALTAASYQIQTPLNLLRAASVMFTNGAGTLEGFAPTLAQITETSEQALRTLQAALPDEIIEPGVSVNVNELVRHVLALETDALLSSGVTVDWRPAHVLPEITARQTELRSLFKNLIDNALQATREGGRSQRELHINTRALEDAVEVCIQDSGPGFPTGDRYKAFEPFYIGWRNRRGRAGMGLPLAQEIANQHGGSIEIDPEYSDGCRVRVTLTNVFPRD